MEKFNVLRELIIILSVSIPISFIFHKLKLPTLVGFLITGALIGPTGFGVISDTVGVKILAEIGIILLLFSIGLEFSSTRIEKIKKFFLFGGIIQVIVTVIIASITTYFLTGNMQLSIFIGFLVSLSSTVIVMKGFIDKGEINSIHGNLSVGVLLFQDLCVVPMLLIIPYLSQIGSFDLFNFGKTIIMAILSIIVIYIMTRLLFPNIIELIARLKNRELFIISIFLMCLGTAYLTSQLGLSLAIGAFLAGFMLSKSDYSHQVIADILPFRDSFNSIFFVSIGMLLSIHSVLNDLMLILAGVFGIIILKVLIIIPIVLAFRYSFRIAIIVGLSLSQIGEFSFILGQIGNENNLISDRYYHAFIAISVISMILTPFLMKVAPKIGAWFQKFSKDYCENGPAESKENLKKHVIIIGYGLNGKNLAKVLKEVGIAYIVVELNANVVKEAKNLGENICYGDFTKQDILRNVGIKDAKIAVIAISDPIATRHGLWIMKNLNPLLYVIVRTRYVSEIIELQKLGADQVIPEEFETSIEIFSRVLKEYHVPKNVILFEEDIIRKEGYKMLRTSYSPYTKSMDLRDIFNLTLTETLLIKEDSKAVGKTILELEIREKTGVTIIAVIREGTANVNPGADFKFKSNDIVIVFGNHKNIDKFIEYIKNLE